MFGFEVVGIFDELLLHDYQIFQYTHHQANGHELGRSCSKQHHILR